jgi:predicted transcriptional regulator
MIASVTSANPALLVLTAKIVAAHAGGNEVPAGAVPDVIRDVYHTLSEIAQNGGGATITQSMPAVQIKKSVSPGRIVCLECGQGFTMLKRHLLSEHDQTPGQYRAKWQLAGDYPMVAPDYSQKRSRLAIAFGLGKNHTRSKHI